MSTLVPAEIIEEIVGARRHSRLHYGRAVSDEEMVYILHSQGCRDSGIDLRECQFSLALDRGINRAQWADREDEAVVLAVVSWRLVPGSTPIDAEHLIDGVS